MDTLTFGRNLVSAPSPHILKETRRLIREGWLRDGRQVIAAGQRDGWELYDIASRRPNHPVHRTAINRATGESTCTCEGHRTAGFCAHAMLAFALSGPVWDWVLGFTVDERAA